MRKLFRLLPLLTLLGCPSSHSVDPDSIPSPVTPTEPLTVGDTVSVSLGVDGGLVQVGELALRVPAGALAEPTTIRVTATSATLPDGFTSYTPVLRFEPAGLVFRTPATIEIPFAGDSRLATVFWTDSAGAFTALPTEIDGAIARTTVAHFSQAFVGTACEGAECCRRAVGAVDVLFVVDNSNSMAEEQHALAREIPRVVQALATGDADADGVQDFPAIASLRTGVVTTDMGTGGAVVPTCTNSRFGDDGILRTRGNTAIAGCEAIYPSFMELASGTEPIETFASHVGCVATTGTNGCGFEQQLEATLKALTPSTSTTRFVEATTGGGFVRGLAESALRRDTGLWLCEHGGVRKEVYVRDGAPVFVGSNVAGELLGEHLVARGVISRGELDMALAVLPRFEGKLGDTLVALELVEPVVLFRQIAEQVRERLLDLFTWESGTAELYRGAGLPPSVGGFPLDLDVWEILRAGVDRRLDAGLEEARFKGHLLDDLERVRQLPSFVQEDALPEELRELLARTATPCPLPDLVDALSRPKDLRRGYRAAALALALDLVAWRH